MNELLKDIGGWVKREFSINDGSSLIGEGSEFRNRLTVGNSDGALLLGARRKQKNTAYGDDEPPFDYLDTVWHEGKEHGISFGLTRSGKFTTAIATNLLNYPGGAFIIDPKGEIYSVTYLSPKAKMGYSRLLDPFHVTDVYEHRTVHEPGDASKYGRDQWIWAKPDRYDSFNPLDVVPDDPRYAYSKAMELVSAIFTPVQGKEDFFNNMAESLLGAVIEMVACHEAYKAERNLITVRREFRDSEALLEYMAASPIEQISGTAKRFQGYAPNTRTSIIAELDKQMRFVDDPLLQDVLQSSTFSLSDIFENDSRVYVVLPANKMHGIYPAWLRLMMKCSLLAAGEYRSADLDYPALWLVDEAKQLGHMDALPAAYNLMAGYGVRVWSFWQSLGDLQSLYPSDWKTMIGNSFVQVLSCGENADARYFAEMSGDHLVSRQSESRPIVVELKNWQKLVRLFCGIFGFDPYRNRGASISTAQHWEPKMRPEEIKTMPVDTQLIRLPGQAPEFCFKVPYFHEWRCVKRARRNPFFEKAEKG